MAKVHSYNPKVSSFSPAWCLRPATTKDLSPQTKDHPADDNKKQRESKSKSPTPRPVNALSSPRIGCMGQIKRHKTSPGAEAAGSQHSSSSSDSTPPTFKRHFSLLQIKRVISSKILLREMDPPRPVEKKKAKEAENSVSLWKRRSEGGRDVPKLPLQLQLPSTEQAQA